MKSWIAILGAALLGAAPAGALGGLNALTPDLNSVLTSEQQALLGCGQFYGTDCAVEGIDLLNTEATTLLQNFPMLDGPPGPIAFRPGLGGSLVPMPGSRGGSDPLFHPFTGEPFTNDLSALSWNYLMTLVALSTPVQPGTGPLIESFDPLLPYRPDGCSFIRPQSCSNLQGYFSPGGPGAAVPEPGAALLFALGFGLVAARLRR